MQNNAKVGGILSIISGAFGLLWLLMIVFILVLILMASLDTENYFNAPADGSLAFLAVFYIIAGIINVILGVLGIVGGVFALRKKHWGWALAGSIAGTLVFFPCGIPAIIFTAMGKPEFEAPRPPAAIQA